MGSGGNWDQKQTLRAGKVKWPTGPLADFTTTDTVTWVEAWVLQRRTGASQASYHGSMSPGATQWKANKLRWKDGKFKKGRALGIALVSWEDAVGKYHNYWWVDDITLV
jgi:hypothetical protein